MTWNRIVFSLVLAAGLLLAPCRPAQLAAKETCLSQGWPQDKSDLKPDPALTFGTLENGLRYVIMPNHEPKGRVSLQLNIQSGSVQERDEQRGVAHYLEHMMFNGTTHYQPGAMVEYFQSIGMAFGPDSNAHTSYDETVYQLMLPNSEEQTVSKGLQLLVDYAGGALLLPKEVDKERGVILAEKRERDSASRRVYKKGIEQAFAGTLLAQRDVIGTEEVLKKADAALLRQYYERWYRPDNMILVAVGDAEPAALQKLISQQFSQLKAKTASPACIELGKVAEQGLEAFYQHEPDLGHTAVSIASVWNAEPEMFTQAAALRRLKEYAATMLLDNRLQRIVNSKDSPLTSASFSSYKMLPQFGITSLRVQTDAGKWKTSLELLNSTLRQALTAGFPEEEMKRVRSKLLSMLKEQVQAAASRKSDDIAAVLISDLNSQEVVLSPAQELELYGPMVEKLTAAELSEVFRSLWHERRLVKVSGTAELLSDKNGTPEAQILAAWQAAEAAELKPWEQEQAVDFPYLPPPAPEAKVAQHTAYEKIGAERYVFSNGLILNLKKTDFEPNEVQAVVVFGKGSLVQPKPGLNVLAQFFIPESGVGKLDQEQLNTALAPYSSKVNFSIDENSFQFRGKGLSSETELLFQLLHTRLHDPAFRADAFERVRRQAEQFYAQAQSSVEGAMEFKGESFLAGGNLRYGLAPWDMVKTLTLADLEGWLRPAFKDEPLEISVVGDFDKEQVLRLVSKYFGEERKGGQQGADEKIIFPSGKKLAEKVVTATNKALVAVAWPTDDFWNITRTRRLNVLAAVLNDRLRKQIREELGAAYSPYVYNQSSEVDPGYGVLRSVVMAEPGQADRLAAKLKQAGADLAAGKVTDEELKRALEPSLTSIRDRIRTNDYWLDNVLIGSLQHPERLEWPLTIQSDFAAVKAEELSALAAKYLQPDKAAEVLFLPEKK
ncbi:M16 family metallopeptidase [Candidatus Electronema sp. JM]|uniref:M16 family metallopeptidase n=1 Tax=Candidatus Electronema sp. JM TaxID=3401571 RepID=UPI003AA7E743